MKKIIVPLLVILFIVSLVVASFLEINLLKQGICRLKKENEGNLRVLEQNKIQIASLQAELQTQLRKNVNELEKQTSDVANIEKETGVYISFVETPSCPSEEPIEFWVKGPDKIPFDAMDLGLTFSNIKSAPHCITGDVFTQYPLNTSTDSSLTITGIAGISTQKIAGGAINKKFASCTFEKKDLSKKASIKLDSAKTHIYSLGKSLLNLDKSFKEIVW